MRMSTLMPFLADLVKECFDADVAEAFIADADMLSAVGRKLNNETDGTREGITRAVKQVADELDDGTADWLVETADSPSGWLYSRI